MKSAAELSDIALAKLAAADAELTSAAGRAIRADARGSRAERVRAHRAYDIAKAAHEKALDEAAQAELKALGKG